jgi:hypothetical protein
MRAASAQLALYLNSLRNTPDATLTFADLFTFSMLNGPSLYYTNTDYPVAYNGNTFVANGPLVQGLKYKCSVGLEVDRQQISIAARSQGIDSTQPADLVNGAMFLQMIADGALDGATVQRDRVFLTFASSPGTYWLNQLYEIDFNPDFNADFGGTPGTPSSVIGGVTLFHGRVSTVDEVGRTTAKLTVASDLVVLDYQMPRNLFSATCLHTLYDAGCGLAAASFATNSTAGAASTTTLVETGAALAAHAQGKIVFNTGANAGISATVQSVVAGFSLTLRYPLPDAPALGDGFTVYYGCDHTNGTCQATFNNLARFRGFPWVPAPQIAY